MILSHAQIEDIAAATTKDFNRFFFREDGQAARSTPRGTPIEPRSSVGVVLQLRQGGFIIW